ncbi:MAG: toll/interleukin-1 receptor domain-containing protein [Chthoniobacterales bacterium]
MNQAFLSYRCESDAHAADVRKLAEKLKAEGLPVVLDQLYLAENPGGPDEGWVRWCEQHAENDACVIICCSQGWFDSYYGKGAPGGGFGAALEATIFSQDIYDEKGQNARIRLAILDDFDFNKVPARLKNWRIFKPFEKASEFEQMSSWVRQRLGMPSSVTNQGGKIVYLAEAKFDLRPERANLCAYLQEKEWQVRPDSAQPRSAGEDELRDALAFVQLLESYPREDDSHRTLLAEARSKVPCFRFRHSKIRLDELDEAHRAFVTEADVVSGAFEDYKVNLLTELNAVWNQKHATLPYGSRNLLVRVVIRGANPDPLWDYVFAAVDAEQDLRAALLEGSESFKDKHDPNVPCHGFLIVCDEAAQQGVLSPKSDLEQCMQIQLGEKNDARRPPVGLLYWPPPAAPMWARLLRVNPPKMHRMVADAAAVLQPFFAEVRRCAN